MAEDNKLGFVGSLGTTINNNPLGFGMRLLNAGLGGDTGIDTQHRQARRAMQTNTVTTRQLSQTVVDADDAR